MGSMTCCELEDGLFWIGSIYIDHAHQNMGIGTKAI
ncbi:hypothetical protein [Cellulosilyticum ruminicola]